MGRIYATVSDDVEERLRRFVFDKYRGHLYKNVSKTVEAAIKHYLDIKGETDKEQLRRILERLADMGVIKRKEIEGIIEKF